MPLRTRYVAAVSSQSIYREPVWSPKRIPSGTRYDVYLRTAPDRIWSEQVYTKDALKASLCLQAKNTSLPLTVATRDTRFGEEIVTVELVNATV